jgi:branched-chain amino acid transport system permease protein
LLTLLPTIFAPLAIYKTFASGALLVGSFLYLPQGIYGALVQILTRLTGSRGDASPAADDAKSAVPAS